MLLLLLHFWWTGEGPGQISGGCGGGVVLFILTCQSWNTSIILSLSLRQRSSAIPWFHGGWDGCPGSHNLCNAKIERVRAAHLSHLSPPEQSNTNNLSLSLSLSQEKGFCLLIITSAKLSHSRLQLSVMSQTGQLIKTHSWQTCMSVWVDDVISCLGLTSFQNSWITLSELDGIVEAAECGSCG